MFNRELLYYHRALELVKENFPQQLQDHTFHDLKKVPSNFVSSIQSYMSNYSANILRSFVHLFILDVRKKECTLYCIFALLVLANSVRCNIEIISV